MKKAIIIINDSEQFGGAEKRYTALFNFISKKSYEYFLIINKTFYNTLTESKLLEYSINILPISLVKENYRNNFIYTDNIKRKKNEIIIKKKRFNKYPHFFSVLNNILGLFSLPVYPYHLVFY